MRKEPETYDYVESHETLLKWEWSDERSIEDVGP